MRGRGNLSPWPRDWAPVVPPSLTGAARGLELGVPHGVLRPSGAFFRLRAWAWPSAQGAPDSCFPGPPHRVLGCVEVFKRYIFCTLWKECVCAGGREDGLGQTFLGPLALPPHPLQMMLLQC